MAHGLVLGMDQLMGHNVYAFTIADELEKNTRLTNLHFMSFYTPFS